MYRLLDNEGVMLSLRRVDTNVYNRYENEVIIIKDYLISIQCNEKVACLPKINISNPNNYDRYELKVFYNEELVIPMWHKEHFSKNGIAPLLKKDTIIEILKYIQSPFCIMMET